MKKHRISALNIICKTALVLLVAVAIGCASGTQDAADVTVTVLQTSDLHGVIAPWDYATDSAFDGGLAKVATVVKQQRRQDPALLLLDCGDFNQDNMIQEFRFDKVPPMIKAFQALKYDAVELGNHEFNFEFETLVNMMRQSSVPVLAANIYKADGKRFAKPYIIKKVKGVRVAIIGLTAPHVPRWEASNPEHFNDMTFTSPMDELGKIVREVEGKADLILCLAHYGEDGEYDTAGMYEVADAYADKVDAFFLGHAHSTLNETRESGALILEPGSKGSSIAKAAFTLSQSKAGWRVTAKRGEILAVKGQNIEPDAELTSLLSYVDTQSRELANAVIGTVGADFLPSLWWNGLKSIPTAVMQDTAMIDLINTVQMQATGADVSLAALFSAESNLTEGDFHRRDGIKIYKYDNTLMAVKITGAQLKKIMEQQAGAFFNTPEKGDVTVSFNPKIRLYNYDMFAGITYEINISKPTGSRIENVLYKGAPLRDDQELVLALNNYRYGGLSASGLISAQPEALTYNSGLAIRDLISEYVAAAGVIMPDCDNNWKLTGYTFDQAAAEKIYALVRNGTLPVPTSADGRTPNVKSLNANTLRAQGLLE